jgi:hypothetical protein
MPGYILVCLWAAVITCLAGCSGTAVKSRVDPGSTVNSVAVINGEGRVVYTPDVLSKKAEKELTLAAVFDLPATDSIAVFLENGQIIDFPDSNARAAIKEGNVCLLDNQQGSYKKSSIIGVVAQPPESRITDVALLANKSMDEDRRVLILFLDGFGYGKYLQAKAQGLLPNISGLAQARKAMTVFPPITPVAFAAMVTGVTPDQTGVKNRSDHNINCPSIFEFASEKGKKALLIEGNSQIINIKNETIYNTDKNNNGLTDDEIQFSVLQAMNHCKYDLLLVHYHSIDDRGHTFGPNASETDEQIKVIDGYAGELMQRWSGDVIIISDHGMHDTKQENRLGNHGEIREEDLFVPLITGEVGM